MVINDQMPAIAFPAVPVLQWYRFISRHMRSTSWSGLVPINSLHGYSHTPPISSAHMLAALYLLQCLIAPTHTLLALVSTCTVCAVLASTHPVSTRTVCAVLPSTHLFCSGTLPPSHIFPPPLVSGLDLSPLPHPRISLIQGTVIPLQTTPTSFAHSANPSSSIPSFTACVFQKTILSFPAHPGPLSDHLQ